MEPTLAPATDETGACRWLSDPEQCDTAGSVRASVRQAGFPGDLPRRSLRLLWIDDDVRPDDPLLRLLEMHGFTSETAASGGEGLALARSATFDAILLDLHLPDLFGMTVLNRILNAGISAPVFVASGYYVEPEVEIEALRGGAAAFLRKPFLDTDALAAFLQSVVLQSTPLAIGLRRSVDWKFDIVAASPGMQRVVTEIQRVGPSSVPVLLVGETGTGKELVARAIHRASGRSSEAFVPVNCGAIPEGLIESELFGHRRGAFTGATSDAGGLFEAAQRGTLLLDEVGDLPLSMQTRLLRCLESGESRRLGDSKTRRVDVRVLAATNRPLRQDVVTGRFRSDLYYRLCVLQIGLPPLRERLEDIEALIAHWIPGIARRWDRMVSDISPGALHRLRGHLWPGNVRELRNVLERAVACGRGTLVTELDVQVAMLEEPIPLPSSGTPAAHPEDFLKVLAVLDRHHWNRTKAARELGMNRSTLWRLLSAHGLFKSGE